MGNSFPETSNLCLGADLLLEHLKLENDKNLGTSVPTFLVLQAIPSWSKYGANPTPRLPASSANIPARPLQ